LQAVRLASRGGPLKNLSVPELPKLAVTNDLTNSVTAKVTNTTASTNVLAASKTGTNSFGTNDMKGTNANVAADSKKAGTNVIESGSSTNKAEAVAVMAIKTNEVSAGEGTNAALVTAKGGTNEIKISGTNGTNAVEKTAKGTNVSSSQKLAGKIGPGGRPDTGKKGPDVPPAVKSRIERITQSEILAPVMHPMPMALLGIAGDQAFLRSPEGQTGMIKEGAELGSIKLLKVGTNRVLVEEKGEKKELTIFSGFGGESLMPAEDKKEPKKDAKKEEKKQPDETTKKAS
jgi:hypothetical protein